MGDFLLFVAIGFAAQLVDGAIGMGYGLTGMALLLSLNLTPATASASIHAAEIAATGASGLSHWAFGNVDWRLSRQLALPGVVGGMIGAAVLILAPPRAILFAVSTYLFVMGGVILRRAFTQSLTTALSSHKVSAVGFLGGTLDAVGGGGWGPIVTSTLIGWGLAPRMAIGSSIAAEFFVAIAVSGTLIGSIGLELWPVIGALIAGGVLAAPFAAYAARRLPDRPLMILVGAMIMLLSARQLALVSSVI